MTYTPFAQSQTWAKINQWFNGLEPVTIESQGISCLFGYDKKSSSITSYNGPVVPENSSRDALNLFLKDVVQYAKLHKIAHINFRGLCPMRKYAANIEDVFTVLNFKKLKWDTIIIDLQLSEDDILKSFKHAARKGIKRAQSLGVQIELCKSFDQYFDGFLIPFSILKGRPIPDKDFHKQGWDLDTDNVYRYWIAKTQDGEPLGFLGTYTYKGVATEIMSALTPLAFEQKLPAQDLLHYEIIKFHKNLGDMHFDLAGFNPSPVDDKEINIRRFKEKWGTNVYDTSSYTLDTRTIMTKIINKIVGKLHG